MPYASLKDKVIAITGGAGGIGLSLATLLAEEGAQLSLADTNKTALDAAGASLAKRGAKVMVTEVNVVDTAQVDAWIADTVKAFGRLDGAANLAGILRYSGPTTDIKDEEFDLVMDVNVKGVYKCLRAQLRAIEAQGNGGSVVNAASLAGNKGAKGFSAYCASKHAVVGITRVAAREFADKQIRVNCVCPTIIDTPMVSDMEATLGRKFPKDNPTGRVGRPDEVAKTIMFLLSDDSTFVSGHDLSITGAAYP